MARVKVAVESVTLTAPNGTAVTVSAASAPKFEAKGYKRAPVEGGKTEKPVKGDK